MTTDTRKYAVIICEDSEKWGGEDGCGKLLVKVFQQNESETWKYFKACSGEIPDINEVENYKGYIVSGSHYSANDDSKWVHSLEKFVKELREYQYKSETAPKLVGVCFGHQLINKALGAKVIKNTGGRFIFKQVDINASTELKNEQYYQKAFGTENTIHLFQSHGEEVIDLPEEGKSVASSDSCPNEIVQYDNSVLTFQGHMEITEDQMTTLILPAIKNAGQYTEQEEAEMWQSLKDETNDRKRVIKMIQTFIS